MIRMIPPNLIRSVGWLIVVIYYTSGDVHKALSANLPLKSVSQLSTQIQHLAGNNPTWGYALGMILALLLAGIKQLSFFLFANWPIPLVLLIHYVDGRDWIKKFKEWRTSEGRLELAREWGRYLRSCWRRLRRRMLRLFRGR